MAQGYIDPATSIHIKNKGTELIKNSTIIVVGALTARAAGDIPAGEIGEVFIAGQWDAPKKAGQAIVSGTPVYWNETDGEFSTTEIAGRAPCYAGDMDAEADDVTMRVILNGR